MKTHLEILYKGASRLVMQMLKWCYYRLCCVQAALSDTSNIQAVIQLTTFDTINLWRQPHWLKCLQGAKVQNWTPIQIIIIIIDNLLLATAYAQMIQSCAVACAQTAHSCAVACVQTD
jgi:hypothetical protein